MDRASLKQRRVAVTKNTDAAQCRQDRVGICRVQIAALVDHRAAQRPNVQLSELMIDPEVDRTAARKKVKQRLSSLPRKYITGQVPKAPLRPKHIRRN